MAGYMKDLGNGKFQFEVSAGRDGKGKRKKSYKTVSLTGSTPEAILKKAEKQLALFVAEVEKGEFIAPTHYTFATYVDVWKKDAERELAPKTFYRYMELLNMRIIPELGNTKLEDITAIQLDSFYNKLREPQKKIRKYANGTEKEITYTLSEQTIKHHHRLISAILAKACKKGIIKRNPAINADAPKVKKHEPKSYEMNDIEALMNALENVPATDFKFKVAVMIAITGGLRLGEIMGLEPGDIDYAHNTIHIQRASQYLPGKGTFEKDTKTEESNRIISLPKEVMDLISQLEHENKVQKVKLGTKWKGGCAKEENEDKEARSYRLFIAPNGSPMHPYSPSKWFHKFLKDNSLPPLVFHGLRHTSASYLIAQGEDVVTVSKRLGHSNTSTTLNVYSHSFKKRDEAAASKMSSLFTKKTVEAQAK